MLPRYEVEVFSSLGLLARANFQQIPYLFDGRNLEVDRGEIDFFVFAVDDSWCSALTLANVLNLELLDVHVIVTHVFVI